jgi:hypothetical protein
VLRFMRIAHSTWRAQWAAVASIPLRA